MTLSFQQTFKDGKETKFIKKIWASLFKLDEEFYWGDSKEWGGCNERQLVNGNTFIATPKIHTIRADKKQRWKPDNKIHFVINNRTPDRFQFAPVILVKSVQQIQILPFSTKSSGVHNEVRIEGRRLSAAEIRTLAKNDGFSNVNQFWKYFDKPFNGKIIHWTDHQY